MWEYEIGGGPVVATAIHNGHDVRPDVADHLCITPEERLREEDPYTAAWTQVAPTRIVGTHSRFQVDVNRPRDQGVYLTSEAAWGLQLWKNGLLPDEAVQRSLAEYDSFYELLNKILVSKVREFGGFVVLDIHSYNHRREGRPAPQRENPDVNVGTGSLDRTRWGPLVDRFMDALRDAGPTADVRENVRFKGGYMSRWINGSFSQKGCCLALEFKKTFMDEVTGVINQQQLARSVAALSRTIPVLQEELGRVSSSEADAR